MNVISVNTSGCYDVVIGSDLIPQTGKYVREMLNPNKAAIISDSNVWPLYGKATEDSLRTAGVVPVSFVFAPGESSKNVQTYLQILNFLAENHISRSDTVIALGGGVVGDITGFAAATFLRGISYVQIPTSLLAMVDSSVGGKTAIDLPAGKNLVGAFKQPSLVLCDVTALNSLPSAVFADGCAEVIKYGVLYDAEFFYYLAECGPAFEREYVISKCVDLKAKVVQDDEFDTDVRQMLNLGHTIGHGIEAASEYQISHGQAVAAGMAIISRAAASAGHCDSELCQHLESIFRSFGLPIDCTFSAEVLYRSALSDKKRSGGSVNLIIPKEIGNCEIIPMPVTELKSFIEAGL